MKHDYTEKEILHAWNHRKYLSGRTKTEANLRAFLDALPDRPGLQEAIDAAILLTKCETLQAALAESERQYQAKVDEVVSLLDQRDQAQAELAALRQPADDGRSLGQVAWEAGNVVQKAKYPDENMETWEDSTDVHDMLEAAAQKVAAVVLAQAVRRMEAVPVEELSRIWRSESSTYHQDLHAVRARLISAAKGEGQAMAKNIPGDKCPACGAEEVESNTPNTTYACGSSDYDGRPETFHPGDKCEAQLVVVNEPPQDEKQPDLSGESEKQDPYARLKAYAKAGARIRINGSLFLTDIIWDWSNPPSDYVVHPDDLHLCPEYAPQAEAQSTTSPGWTPTVGQTVRLKSGGPVMTVTGVDPLSLMCAWMNTSNELQVEPITTPCLTQVPNP